MARTTRKAPVAIGDDDRYIYQERDWGFGGNRGQRRSFRRAKQAQTQQARRSRQRDAQAEIAAAQDA